MKTIYTSREKPQWVKDQEERGYTVIHNAPRPIYGDAIEDTWSMDFLHGRHYSALDPNSEYYAERVRLNEQNDAVRVEYVNELVAYERGLKWYRVYLGNNPRVNIEAEKYHDDVVNKGIELMNGFEEDEEAQP
jgi:hypothetical protein